MNVIPPRFRTFCTHPANVTDCPMWAGRNSPQVFVLYIFFSSTPYRKSQGVRSLAGVLSGNSRKVINKNDNLRFAIIADSQLLYILSQFG